MVSNAWPTRWSHPLDYRSDHNLPPTLIRVLADPQRPQKMETPTDVAFPMEPGEYVMCWRTPQGENRYADDCIGPQHARLARFIKDTTTVPGGRTTRTVFGPTASFFSVSERGYCWQNLPQALEDDMHASFYVRQPTTVALGAHGAYIVLYSDGAAAFDLRGLYPLVEGMMRNTQEVALRRGIAVRCLSLRAE
ncbi:hypothetical protein GGX14DRAFT_199513 [Mycena pura]|uniref:Uncharacterized protein n=1 Tax=Mycena pura TaxID=153505 RepID=A0AAD6UWB3_9AGAR|nr:hypothetical protein GGX14DRAFT_199513 [Mycena pura]